MLEFYCCDRMFRKGFRQILILFCLGVFDLRPS